MATHLAPTVTINPDGGATLDATATAAIDSIVTGLTITDPGSGYTSAPTVTINPDGGATLDATATAEISSVVTAVTITDPGSGYTLAPTVTINPDGGATLDATATAEISSVVTAVTITDHGSGYTLAPTVTINPDGGATLDATATAVLDGTVLAVTITDSGSSYSTTPTVEFTGGGGTDATATVALETILTDLTITDGGAGYTTAPTVTISGGGATSPATAEGVIGDDELAVEVNGVTYTVGDGNLTHDNVANTWSLTIPPSELLADKDVNDPYDVTVTVVNPTVPVKSATAELVVDTQPPSQPTVNTAAFSSYTPTITGDAVLVEFGQETLTVEVNGKTYTTYRDLQSGPLSHDAATDTWSLVIPAVDAMLDGEHVVTVTVEDLAGNTPQTDSDSIYITVEGESIPTVATQLTNDSTPTISGTAILDGIVASIAVDNGGSGYSTATVAITGGGATSDATATATIVGDAITAITITNPGSGYTSEPTVTITGDGTLATATATPSIDELTVEVNGVTYTVGDGNLSYDGVANAWDLTIPGALADGDFPVVASVVYQDGSTAIGGNTIQIDATDPLVPAVDSLSDFTTATPTITGSATLAAGDVLTVLVDGVTYRVGDGNLSHDGGANTWSLTIPSGKALPNDTYSVQATVNDAAGNNSSDSENITVLAFGTAPVAPLVVDQITNSQTPTVTGRAVLGGGETLSVEVNGVTYTVGDGNLTHNNVANTWSLTIPLGENLTEGTYPVTATLTNALLGQSPAGSGTLEVDTTDPAPSLTITGGEFGSPVPTITGSATLGGEVLTVEVNGVTYTAGDGNLSHNGVANTWSLTIPSVNALTDGEVPVAATVTDAAGNSVVTTENITIDLDDPIAPIVIGQIVNTPLPTLTGYARVNTVAGDSLFIEVDDGVNTPDRYEFGVDAELSYDNAASTWALDLTEADEPLVEGTYTVTAIVENQSGDASHIADLVVDTTQPSIAPAVDEIVADFDTPNPTITGSATLGAGEVLTVEVNGVSYTALSGQATGPLTHNAVSNTWSLTIPAINGLGNGDYAVKAIVTDQAGNSVSNPIFPYSVVSSTLPAGNATAVISHRDTAGNVGDPLTVYIDVSSTAPTVDAQITNSQTPTITGTALVGTGETLTVEVNSVTYTASDGNLFHNGTTNAWDLLIPPANILPTGDYVVAASVTSANGSATGNATITVDLTVPSPLVAVGDVTSDVTYPVLSGSGLAYMHQVVVQVLVGTMAESPTFTGELNEMGYHG